MKPPFLSLLTLFLLFLTMSIFAQVPNHMELITTMTGDFNGELRLTIRTHELEDL